MGLPDQAPSSSPHLYPQALQLKLYQAFIFSIPILFSIILFLLFYLFYLKRRASSNPSLSPRPVIARISRQAAPYLPSSCQMGLKGELKSKLPIVVFDEQLGRKDSQCCVCLGEFEMEEELLQMPSCKHVFHIDCIHHWLHANSTCPLCRCSVTAAAAAAASSIHPPPHQTAAAPLPMPQPSSSSETVDNPDNCPREHSVVLDVRQEGP